MRRLILLGLVVFLCLPMAVYAAGINGAETQGQGKLGVGVEQELVFNRDMKYVKGTEGLDWQKVKIDSMSRTMAKISYGLLGNLDIYAKLGVADIKGEGKANNSFSGEEGIYAVKTNNALAWGLGAKATYEFADDWLLGADVQYLRHKHNSQVFFTDSDSWKADYAFQEWQVGPYVAKRMDKFTPYIGMMYSDLRMNHKDEEGTVKFKADNNFGVFTGVGYKITDSLSLNAESRFINESAMSVACVYKF